MAVAYIASSGASGNVTALNPVIPSNIQDGDFILAAWVYGNTNTPGAVPAGFTTIATTASGTTSATLAYRMASSDGGVSSYTWSCGSSNRQTVSYTVYTGVHATTPIGTAFASTAEGVTTTAHITPTSTAVANSSVELSVITEGNTTGSSPWTAPTGSTIRSDFAATGSGGTSVAVSEFPTLLNTSDIFGGDTWNSTATGTRYTKWCIALTPRAASVFNVSATQTLTLTQTNSAVATRLCGASQTLTLSQSGSLGRMLFTDAAQALALSQSGTVARVTLPSTNTQNLSLSQTATLATVTGITATQTLSLTQNASALRMNDAFYPGDYPAEDSYPGETARAVDQVLALSQTATLGIVQQVTATSQVLTLTQSAAAAQNHELIISAVQVLDISVTDQDFDLAPNRYFTTPHIPERVYSRQGLLGRLHIDKGVTILKFGSVYKQYTDPATEDISAADQVYLGGRTYTVGYAESLALEAAGYGDWVHDTPNVPLSDVGFILLG